jgi:phage shock protein PspC (stress-responsive transcriptional regulator)
LHSNKKYTYLCIVNNTEGQNNGQTKTNLKSNKMEKVVSAHLGGKIFQMEEEVYSRIISVTEGQWKKEEIESSLAEYFEARQNPSQVITSHELSEAFKRMGYQEPEKKILTTGPQEYRRIFRHPQTKILGGVCGGLGVYLNADPVLFRVLFLLGFFVGFGFILYIILWIVIPLGTEKDLQFSSEKN